MKTARASILGGVGLAGAFLVAGALTVSALGRATTLRSAWPTEGDNLYLPSSGTLRLLSLGHTELAADLVAARANVYFGTQIMGGKPQRWLSRYLHTAADLDPQFHRLYLSGAAMLVYNGQRITPEAVLEANALLERGTKSFPLDWEILFQKGFNDLFELPNVAGEDDPRVPAARQRGVEALRQAALFEGVPYWVPSLVARMLTKRGSEELAMKHLEQAYAVAATEEGRAQILRKLAALRGQAESDRLDEERRRWREMLDTRYPYAPEAFSVVAGPRRGRSVSVDAPP